MFIFICLYLYQLFMINSRVLMTQKQTSMQTRSQRIKTQGRKIVESTMKSSSLLEDSLDEAISSGRVTKNKKQALLGRHRETVLDEIKNKIKPNNIKNDKTNSLSKTGDNKNGVINLMEFSIFVNKLSKNEISDIRKEMKQPNPFKSKGVKNTKTRSTKSKNKLVNNKLKIPSGGKTNPNSKSEKIDKEVKKDTTSIPNEVKQDDIPKFLKLNSCHVPLHDLKNIKAISKDST